MALLKVSGFPVAPVRYSGTEVGWAWIVSSTGEFQEWGDGMFATKKEAEAGYGRWLDAMRADGLIEEE
jgi:hypothetical protein